MIGIPKITSHLLIKDTFLKIRPYASGSLNKNPNNIIIEIIVLIVTNNSYFVPG
ncbi:unnamed protein product [marine sediment metagenome]|uniref:Uncharacterized protein n=2 Tax=marine sediment metagenome TaxID=412755 RepID=X1B453_9ZZZZ